MKPTSRLLPLLSLLLLALTSPLARAAESAAQENMNIIQTILHGGPLIILIWVCILGTSMVMLTFIIQLFVVLRDEQLAPAALVQSLRDTIHAGNYQEAWEICRANKAYIALVLKGALERLGRGKDAVETALIEHGIREAQILKTKNSYLSVIGVIAPMIGLLGTVIGMMGAFAVLGSSGVADPRSLALRIGEVLMATASGLFIAIPAFIFYYYFRNRATIVLVNADDQLNRLVEDIPFEELSGVRIGETFEAGAGAGVSTGSRKVSMALTTNCPVCNGAIQSGQNPCPQCGATLDWA
ncbi:MAG: MotA/TolQ/ExbB proton channel family protein [Verrucomicrobiaceae bacterium]|nr:MAG: MotA/TolQ/ExbB proton channel family protein [Verrucomicrobiaceae bacterium]